MMDRFAAVLAALLLMMVVCPARGQSGLRLRAAYHGSFLPEDTEVVVLARSARTERSGRMQPDFFSRDAYPREADLVFRRDVLGQDGFSSRTYPPSDQAGQVYFLYALAPDSTLYWSFSAERDALKFDVVQTGVMSVAPIRMSPVRRDIIRMFFRPRVTVHMPTDGVTPDSLASTGMAAADLPETTAAAEPAPSPPPVAAAAPPVRRAASSRPATVPLLVLLGVSVLAGVGAALRYRGEVRRLRKQLISDPGGDNAGVLQAEVIELRRENDELRREHADLRARCEHMTRDTSGRAS